MRTKLSRSPPCVGGPRVLELHSAEFDFKAMPQGNFCGSSKSSLPFQWIMEIKARSLDHGGDVIGGERLLSNPGAQNAKQYPTQCRHSNSGSHMIFER